MDRIISLLREKTEYLEKFYAINENELINFAGGDFSHVEGFYQARDKILDLIRCIDALLDEENGRPGIVVTDGGRREIELMLKQKDEWVEAILAQDLRIIEYVEKEKSNIIRELRVTRQARRAVGAYANVERWKELDKP